MCDNCLAMQGMCLSTDEIMAMTSRRGMIFVDTNILIDIATRDPVCRRAGPYRRVQPLRWLGHCMFQDAVYAELSVRYDRIEHLDDFLAQKPTSK
jgi:hypothetical protein